MKKFEGFPSRMQFTPVPNLFFSALLPEIKDISELKLILHIFRVVYSKKGMLRYVSYNELVNDKTLLDSLAVPQGQFNESLKIFLKSAVERGLILNLPVTINGKNENVYFLNTVSDRRVMERVKNGELALSGLRAGLQVEPETANKPPSDIFTVYEENIGMLTPMIADELREAEKIYPEGWINDAVKEAVSLNKRNWRYIERILENWTTEGRGDGTHRGDTKTDTDKFSRQKYGHIFQR